MIVVQKNHCLTIALHHCSLPFSIIVQMIIATYLYHCLPIALPKRVAMIMIQALQAMVIHDGYCTSRQRFIIIPYHIIDIALPLLPPKIINQTNIA